MKGVDKTISSYILLILFLFTQLVVRKGSVTEQYFRETSDAVKQKIWIERILPNINDSIYKV